MLDPKEIAAKLLDEEGLRSFLGDDILDGVIKVKLDELVESSENSLDDAIVEMIYPVVKAAVMDYIDGKLNELQPDPAA